MTISIPATPAPTPRKFGTDISTPVLYGFAAVLCVLIVLPLSWLFLYSLTDAKGQVTLANFYRLFSESAFLEPLITTFIIATSSAFICCAVAAPMGWLVARTDLPGSGVIRALVTASFVTPPFLGAIAWELLAAPNSGLLNKSFRAVTGAGPDVHLFNIYTIEGIIFVISCYTFPYVFVLVANSLDRTPGELEDASSILGGGRWYTARRITIPLVLPALLAGALVAFLQAMTLFGSPAILALPAGFHTMTTKIWSLFQYPPKPELAAAASLPLLVLTVFLLRAEHMILGRRGYSVVGGKYGAPRLIPLHRWRWPAFVHVFDGADAAGVPALCRAVQRGVLAGRHHVPDLQERDLAQYRVRAVRPVGGLAGAQEHGHPRRRHRHHRHRDRGGHRLRHRAPGGDRAIASSASSPPRRSPFPASCSASACS